MSNSVSSHKTCIHYWTMLVSVTMIGQYGQTSMKIYVLIVETIHLYSLHEGKRDQSFSGVRVTRSLVWCVCFVDRCLSICTFSFGHCVVCSSSIYGFWLPLWYLQTLLTNSEKKPESNPLSTLQTRVNLRSHALVIWSILFNPDSMLTMLLKIAHIA
jgi:hypothetical protein